MPLQDTIQEVLDAQIAWPYHEFREVLHWYTEQLRGQPDQEGDEKPALGILSGGAGIRGVDEVFEDQQNRPAGPASAARIYTKNRPGAFLPVSADPAISPEAHRPAAGRRSP